MEFGAYPAPASQGFGGSLRKAYGLLHGKDSLLLPGSLLLLGVGLVAWEHKSMTRFSGTSTRNFLGMILVTMLPLGLLEKKIFACPEPVSLISKASGKVMLLHACFLAVRTHQHYFDEGPFSANFIFCSAGFLAACALLPSFFGFRPARAVLCEYSDAWCVVALALAAAVLSEGFTSYMGRSYHYQWSDFLFAVVETGALYLELMAFVPAVWMVCRTGERTDAPVREVDVADTRRRALVFFAFALGFYFTEDVIGAINVRKDNLRAAAGHLAHFFLLLDFAGFVLAHLFDPKKLDALMGSFMSVFREACSV